MEDVLVKGLALLAATLFGAVVNGFTSRGSLAARLATIETTLKMLQASFEKLESKVESWPRSDKERAFR